MDIKRIFQNHGFKIVILSIAGLLVVLLSFRAGMVVGYRRAGFSENWGNNYHRNFAGPKGGFMDDFKDRDYLESSGTFGQILKIDGQTIAVKSREGVEKTILVNEKTEIRRFRDTVKIEDLKTDEFIVTIGEPNEVGQMVAKLIRVMPPPPKNGPNNGMAPGQSPQPPMGRTAPDQLPPPPLDGTILTPTPNK